MDTTGAIPDNGPTIVGAMWAVTISPLFVLILRLYCKFRLSKIFGADDWILICSWVLLAAYTACITASVTLGVGKHAVDIDPAKVSPALELVYIGEFLAIIGCSLSKTCFAITLLRTVTRKWQKALLWWIVVSMNLIMWLCAILYLAQCQPTARLWDFSIEATCWDPNVMTIYVTFAGSYSGLMDFVLAFLPWSILWHLQMKRREKVGVGIAMSLGVFAGITAIIKTSYLHNIAVQEDFTYYCSSLLIWAATETGVTIIAVSIPYLRTLVRDWRSSAYYDAASSGRDGGGGNSYQLSEKPKHSTGLRGIRYLRSNGTGTGAGGRGGYWADRDKDLEATVLPAPGGNSGDEGSEKSILGGAEREVRVQGGGGGRAFHLGNASGSGERGNWLGGADGESGILKSEEVVITFEGRERREGNGRVALSPGPARYGAGMR